VLLGLPSFVTNHWDPLFAAAEGADMAICMHIGSSSKINVPSPEASSAVPIAMCGLNSMSATADLVFSGILNRHPKVRIAPSEGGSGRVPYLLERMDYTWERTRLSVDRSVAPSELFRRHFSTCFISDHAAVQNRYEIGIEKLMWEYDYPHNDSNWPSSCKLLEEELADVPDDEAGRSGELNARTVFDWPRTARVLHAVRR
jgi:predicted TIM-barrel fold metal-dependent hydrolase